MNLRDVFPNTNERDLNQALMVMVGLERTVGSDPDGDDLWGSNDRCPGMAEDRNGYQDSDGCPDNDDDDDDIPVGRDGCPDVPEDHNGSEDEDGCPDQDSDGDGIIDTADACRYEPFKYNKALGPENAELLTRYYPTMFLTLEGHTLAPDGSMFGKYRAKAVQVYLESQGVLPHRFKKPKYVFSSSSPRVEVIIDVAP